LPLKTGARSFKGEKNQTTRSRKRRAGRKARACGQNQDITTKDKTTLSAGRKGQKGLEKEMPRARREEIPS